ncbi:YadA-like family protein [Pseudomonas sp. NY15437]|uniref:YadA-like family protein n=1 Tax=Pseudomonas sp. NY15437 TaxID=3400360 RepID=UPI003A875854
MNKVYRLVWNAALNAWVVACEFATAKGKGKSGSRRKKVRGAGLAATSLALAIGASQAVWADDVQVGNLIDSSVAVGNAVAAPSAVSSSAALAYSTALGDYRATEETPSAALASTSYSVAPASSADATPSTKTALLGATLKSSAGSTESHYFSVNDNNVQSANYLNDGAVGTNATAAGVGAKTNGARATALGYNTSAGAIDSLALGSGSSTTAIGSMAIGTGASTAGVNAIAQGFGATATPNDSIAIGTNAQTKANDASIAIGKDTVAQSILGPGSVALGNEAQALNSGSVAIGYQALADEANPPSAFTGNVAIGRMAHATNSLSDPSEASTAVGNESFADKGGVGIGERTNAAGKLSTALGNSASATMDNAVAVGAKAKATAVDAVAIGNGAAAQQARSVALGVSSTTSAAVATQNIQIGNTTYDFAGVAPTSTVSIGNVGNERTLTNVAAGRISRTSTDAINGSQLFAVTSAVEDVASTPLTFAGNTGSTAKQLGDTLTIQGAGSTAGTYSGANLKTEVDANGQLNLLMADNPAFTSVTAGGTTTLDASGLTIANGPSVTTAGIDAGGQQIKHVAQGTDGTDAVNVDQLNDSINRSAKTHYYSVNDNGVQGDNYNNDGATGVNALAAGVGAKAAQDGAVALGSGSVTDAAVATTSTTIAGTSYQFAGNAPTSTVSVGSVGNERTLTNVAAGRLSATSTDAVNGSQLFATNSAIDHLDAGAVKYDTNPDGSINYGSVTLGGDTYNSTTKTGGTRITNVAAGVNGGDAVNVDQLNSSVDGARSHYYSVNDNGVQGDNYNNDGATGVNALAAGVGAKAAQDGAVALGSGSVTDAAVATTGTTIAGTDYQFAGNAPTSTVSVGSVGNERTITNVAAGRLSATSTDAVNGSQLFATNSAIDHLDAGAVKYDTNPDGSINYGSVTLGGDTYNSATKTGGTRITNVAAGVNGGDAVNVDQLNSSVDGAKSHYYSVNDNGVQGDNYNNDGATGVNALAAGVGAKAAQDGAVALGSGSVTDAAVATTGTTIAGTSYQFAGTAPTSTVSVGSVGNERTITNVAAGRLSATSTDAVNGSQLFATNSAIDHLDAGAVKYDLNADGSINYNSVTLGGDTYDKSSKTGGTRITNVARGVDDSDAVNMSQLNETNAQVAQNTTNIGDVDGRVTNIYDTGTKYFHANSTGTDAVASGQDSVAIGMGAVSGQANSVALGAGSVTDAAVATTGTTLRGVNYTFAGTSPTSTVSVGSVGNERTITNVAAGRLSETSTDAVNGSQLYATNQALETITAGVGTLDKGAVKYVTKPDGSIDYSTVNLGGDTYDSTTRTGGTRITNVAAGVDGGDAVNVDQLNVAMSNAETHYYSVNDNGQKGGNYANDGAQGKNSLAAGVNASATSDAGVALGSDSVAKRDAGTAGYVPATATDEQAKAIAATTSTRGAVSVGDADNGVYRQITGVAAGSEDSDAVNVAQLKSVANNANASISNVADGKDGMFQVNNTSNLAKPKATGKDAVAGGAGAQASGDNAVAVGTRSKATASNSVALGNDSVADRANSVSVGSAGAERQITNLAAGSADTDAVNVAQLNKATGDINNNINGVYTDLKRDLKKQDDTLSAGIAGALAAATLPQPYTPGASMASVGMGNYRGQNALAIGVSRISDNGKWVTKLSGNTDTQGQFGVSVGVGYQW